MQFLIDTATDSPTELYKIGRFLCDQFECMPVPAQDAVSFAPLPPAQILKDIAADLSRGTTFTQPLPQFPGTSDDVIGDNDPEIEIDNDGSITSVTVSAELSAPPSPPPVPNAQYIPAVVATVAHILPPPLPMPPGPAVSAELDSRGMPWDARIHASNRSKTIKSEWKRKRGVDDNLVTACEAQNKPGNAPASTVTAPPVSVPPTVSTAASPATMAAGTGLPAAPPPPPVSFAPPLLPSPPISVGTVVPAAVAPSAPVTIDFRGLMQKIQAASAAGKLTPDQVNAALAGVGLKPEEMAQLINNAPLIASVNAAVDRCLI